MVGFFYTDSVTEFRVHDGREKKSYLLNKFDPFIGYLDLTLFVKTTDCLLKYFFTHLKFPFYILWRAFVSKFGFPSNCLEVIQDFVES